MLKAYTGLLLNIGFFEAVPDQQYRPTSDRGVCDIERGPMISKQMEIKKINYGAYAYPVYQIAQRAAENKA